MRGGAYGGDPLTVAAAEEDEFGDSVEGDSVDERVETGLAWPPMHRDASVLRADDGYDAMDDNNRGDDGYNDDDYDDDAATALDRSAAGLSLPSQLGLSASRVQLLNSVLFQDEYRDEDGIRRVAALDRHTAAPPNYWGRVPASPMHVTMSQEARPRADEDVMAFLTTSASASSMVPRFIAASQPAPRMYGGSASGCAVLTATSAGLRVEWRSRITTFAPAGQWASGSRPAQRVQP